MKLKKIGFSEAVEILGQKPSTSTGAVREKTVSPELPGILENKPYITGLMKSFM